MAESPEMSATILFGDSDEPHLVGDQDCGSCWKGPGACDCGGLIHYEFGDENMDGDYWLYSQCDECGGHL